MWLNQILEMFQNDSYLSDHREITILRKIRITTFYDIIINLLYHYIHVRVMWSYHFT